MKHEKKKNYKIIWMINKFLFTILVTITTLIVLKTNSGLKTSFYKHVYEENISFAQINNTYQKYFGKQLPFTDLLKENTEAVFSEKLVYSSKKKFSDGVELEVTKNYLVPILESGMIVFIGEKEGYGNTVIVQQINGIDVWYSNINVQEINLYDYLEKGALLGESKDTKLYLVFKKDGTILNYEDYI